MTDKRLTFAREALELIAARHLGKLSHGEQTTILQAVIGLQQLTEEPELAQRIIGSAVSPAAMRANEKGKAVRHGSPEMGRVDDVPAAKKPDRKKRNKNASN